MIFAPMNSEGGRGSRSELVMEEQSMVMERQLNIIRHNKSVSEETITQGGGAGVGFSHRL